MNNFLHVPAPSSGCHSSRGSDCVVTAVGMVQPGGPFSAPPVLVSSWSSRTAQLHRIRCGAHGSDVVVKVLNDPSEATALVLAINELAAILSIGPSEEFLPVSAMGLPDTIGGVMMPFVEGSTLEQILTRAHVGCDVNSRAIVSFITSAGRLLARYHGRYAELSSSQANEAWDDLACKTKAVLGPHADARSLLNPSSVSRSFGDFHPGHLIATGDGRLAAIDPSAAPRYRFVGRDIAGFIDRMIMDVLSPRSLLREPARSFSYGELSAAFLRGYTDISPTALSQEDRIAIDIYLAFLLKRRLRWVAGGQWAALLYYGVMLAYRYRRALYRLRAAQPPSPISLRYRSFTRINR